MSILTEQQKVIDQLDRIVEIFVSSEAEVRPHFILTGPSGSGKSHIIQQLSQNHKVGFLELNAAQLTKEGTAGNSLSKALSPLMNMPQNLTICFVDEFDKLFISGNSNSQLAHETTNGVQNEFLKVLESKQTSVYGDYGKYVDVSVEKVLFVFAGAFNGEEDLNIDRLREFGIKTEFLGRVGLQFGLTKLSVESMRVALENSLLLENYLALFPKAKRKEVITDIMQVVEENHEKNTLGIRLLNTLIHQYFINGGVLEEKQTQKTTFQKTMEL